MMFTAQARLIAFETQVQVDSVPYQDGANGEIVTIVIQANTQSLTIANFTWIARANRPREIAKHGVLLLDCSGLQL
jgi:hypothetical protein